MKFILLIFCFVAPTLAQTDSIENGWKGIKVLQSTRSDIEKILGEPMRSEYGTITYDIDEGLIHFVYSASPCSIDGRGRFDVPKDTVIEYQVVLTNYTLFKDLKWKKEL